MQKLKAQKDYFIANLLPFIKSLLPQILIIFGCCLYVSLGLFSAAVLGILSINQEDMPWPVFCYTVIYFTGLAGLISAEFLTKKDWHFIAYILLTTPINLVIALLFYSQVLFNFFDGVFPKALFFAACAFVFYVTDYNPKSAEKRKKTNKKN